MELIIQVLWIQKTATELAVGLGIKVYTIGLGTNGTASFPYAKDPKTGKLLFRSSPVEIDEELLQYIAKETEGQYFRATDNSKLKAIYEEINKLEKTEIEEFKYYNYQENYRILVLIAGFFNFNRGVIKKHIILRVLFNVCEKVNCLIGNQQLIIKEKCIK